MKNRRKKLVVDSPVQWTLVKRVLRHWVFVLVLTQLLLPFWYALISWDIINSASSFGDAIMLGWERTLPLLVFFLAIAPIITYDVLKLSNRFAGPIYRLHKGIKSLNEGEESPPIELRKDDFWKNVVEDFNVLSEQVAEMRKHEIPTGCLEPAT